MAGNATGVSTVVAVLVLSLCSGQNLRLPRHVVPQNYNIRLLPVLEEGNYTTVGYEEVDILCVQTASNITLHAKYIDVSSAQVFNLNSSQELTVSSISNDSTTDFLIVRLAQDMEVNAIYRLSINFVSILNDELKGLYRSTYDQDGITKVIAATQMQAIDARRAFPCFDEPNMKATFTITLGRKLSMTSTSNMPLMSSKPIESLDGYVWDEYERSPPMSTYLVAMLVSEFLAVESDPGLSRVLFRIWSRPSAINQTEYARRIGPSTLDFYEQYFKIDFPLLKQDMAAIPDFGPGAMENWGLITYRETSLLYDPSKSSMSDKEAVASIIAHEIAHQWFGDLVTMDWWSDLWLNEGFATFMSNLALDQVAPEFRMLDTRIGFLHGVFGVDALEQSHPISVPVENPNQINSLFDSISYDKGASILQMLENFLGAETFRKGLQLYLETKKYGNAVSDELWASLTQQAAQDQVALPDSVKTIMDTWTLQTGYPVVQVLRNYSQSTASLIQKRFLLRPEANSSDLSVWWIPISYRIGAGGLTIRNWMEPENNLEISAASPNQVIIVNIDEMGYYRVNYDDENWALIDRQLTQNHQVISLLNRAQIMDDSLNIARAKQLDYEVALNLTRYLSNEREFVPWRAALEALSYLDVMLTRSSGYGDFKRYLLKITNPLYQYVGFNATSTNEDPMVIYSRSLVLSWRCRLGAPECVAEARNHFNAWMNSPGNSVIPADQERVIICTAIANGVESDWNFVFGRYLESETPSQKAALLYSLSCSNEAWILTRLLECSLNSTSGIRRADSFGVFQNVAANPIGNYIAFNYLQTRWTQLLNYFPSLTSLARVVDAVSRSFNTPLQVQELKKLRDDHLDELGSAIRSFEQSIERAESNVQWMQLHYEEVVQWLQKQS